MFPSAEIRWQSWTSEISQELLGLLWALETTGAINSGAVTIPTHECKSGTSDAIYPSNRLLKSSVVLEFVLERVLERAGTDSPPAEKISIWARGIGTNVLT